MRFQKHCYEWTALIVFCLGLVCFAGSAMGNEPPGIPIVTIDPESPGPGDDLTCNFLQVSSDPDGDPVYYNFEWYVNGQLFTGSVGDEVLATYTSGGDYWECVVTPTDGTDVGPSDSAWAMISGGHICQDDIWDDYEFCGVDARTVTGEVDMNHDCVKDFLDLTWLYSQIGLEGPNLSGDLSGNGAVGIEDINDFTQSYYSGNPVTPCNPTPQTLDYCGANLSLSLDPNIIVSRGRATVTPPYPFLILYVVASDWSNAGAIEYAFVTSPNVDIVAHTFLGDWTGLESINDGVNHYVGTSIGFPQTSTTLVAEIWVMIPESQSATMEIVDYGGSAPPRRTRWSSQDLDHRTEFLVRRNLGINMIDPISTTGCQLSNLSPTLAITDPSSDIQVASTTASYEIEGSAVDPDGTIVLVEYRVNDGPWQSIPVSEPWTIEVILVPGENWIQVRAADNEGAYSSTQVVSIEQLGPPDLAITAWSGPATLSVGCVSADVSVTVQNVSSVDAPACRLGFYLSTDAVIDASDYPMDDTYSVPALSAGASTVINMAITIPDDGPRGAVHLGAFVDDLEEVDESNETNNTDSSPLDFPIPAINSIVDVENDQGRVVRINLSASSRDALGSTTPILQYEAFRRIDPLLAGKDRGPALVVQGTRISDFPKQAGWEFVGAVPAHGNSEYNMIVPTLADETDGVIPWSVFFVRAATAQPLVFFDSCPESGYSVDNLAPSPPKSLAVAYASGGNQLSWEPCPEEDFRYFKIYRSSTPDFVPDEGNLIEVTIGTDWLDDSSDPWSFYYQISSVDFAGNESEMGMPAQVTGAPDSEIPVRTALLNAVPNPFNPTTKLPFQMAAAGHAVLKVYDTAGHLVATLVDEPRTAGRHDVIWDGRDDTGRMSSAGVYLYRFEAEGFSMTKRMVLLK